MSRQQAVFIKKRIHSPTASKWARVVRIVAKAVRDVVIVAVVCSALVALLITFMSFDPS